MRFKIWLLSASIFLGGLGSQAALAADSLAVAPVGLLNLSSPRINLTAGTSTSVSSNVAFGFGGLVYFPLVPFFGIETGALYLPQKFTYTSTDVEVTLTHLQIPVLVRFTPIPFVSVGAGGYFGLALGNVNTQNSGATTSVSTTYTTANLSTTDIGLILSAALELPVAPLTSLLVDARYLLGIKDISQVTTQSVKLGGILFMLGLKIGI